MLPVLKSFIQRRLNEKSKDCMRCKNRRSYKADTMLIYFYIVFSRFRNIHGEIKFRQCVWALTCVQDRFSWTTFAMAAEIRTDDGGDDDDDDDDDDVNIPA